MPDPKKGYSVRLHVSTLAKLDAIVSIWRARAQAKGQAKEVVDEIDTAHVVNVLLADAADAELGQWGGFPETKEQLKTVIEAILSAANTKQ